ncbi:hypothetical protein [Thiomicrorhabdus sp. Milos-T2]|uniref:hypothetical protein n=1 Tax=Thiomicrorhabdus sp. Milos-T2 TaxID=90814 RepID=UPI00056FE6F9|nr:hypothetical protein [Thiomicrorhabdus sp. Milos-T2]
MGKASNRKRVQRELGDLVFKLFHHLLLLKEYSHLCFYEYNHLRYTGEIAGKLRLLAVRQGQNKPLLIKLMDHYNFVYRFPIRENSDNKFTLSEYMEHIAGLNGKKYLFTNKGLVRHLSQQTGSAHEDWSINNELDNLLKENLLGGPSSMALIRPIVNTVLSVGYVFLLYLQETGELSTLKIQYDLKDLISIGTRYPQQTSISPEERKKNSIDPKPINPDLDLYERSTAHNAMDTFKVDITQIIKDANLS